MNTETATSFALLQEFLANGQETETIADPFAVFACDVDVPRSAKPTVRVGSRSGQIVTVASSKEIKVMNTGNQNEFADDSIALDYLVRELEAQPVIKSVAKSFDSEFAEQEKGVSKVKVNNVDTKRVGNAGYRDIRETAEKVFAEKTAEAEKCARNGDREGLEKCLELARKAQGRARWAERLLAKNPESATGWVVWEQTRMGRQEISDVCGEWTPAYKAAIARKKEVMEELGVGAVSKGNGDLKKWDVRDRTGKLVVRITVEAGK